MFFFSFFFFFASSMCFHLKNLNSIQKCVGSFSQKCIVDDGNIDIANANIATNSSLALLCSFFLFIRNANCRLIAARQSNQMPLPCCSTLNWCLNCHCFLVKCEAGKFDVVLLVVICSNHFVCDFVLLRHTMQIKYFWLWLWLLSRYIFIQAHSKAVPKREETG